MIGSGNANAGSRSTGSRVGHSSSRSWTISSIRGRSASTRRGVNAELTSRRSRVCFGASELSMLSSSATDESPKILR